MKRIALAVVLLAGLAGCGPDCDRFCQRWVNDCGAQTGATDFQHCVSGCNEVGGDYAAFISCAIDKSCPELAAGQCQIPSVPPGFVQ
jgi:hypothetical protein